MEEDGEKIGKVSKSSQWSTTTVGVRGGLTWWDSAVRGGGAVPRASVRRDAVEGGGPTEAAMDGARPMEPATGGARPTETAVEDRRPMDAARDMGRPREAATEGGPLLRVATDRGGLAGASSGEELPAICSQHTCVSRQPVCNKFEILTS